MDVKVRCGADIVSDYQLQMAAMRLKMRSFNNPTERPYHKVNVHFLRASRKGKSSPAKSTTSLRLQQDRMKQLFEEHLTEL